MDAAIWFEPTDVSRRLMELGVSQEALQAAVYAGHTARLSCTDNDPPFIPGTEAWRFVLRTLREGLLPLGWRKDDPGNFSLVINDARRINIVVESGDTDTGVRQAIPRTRSLKGLYTEAAIARNVYAIGDLFPETIPDDVKKKALILEYPTYVLLIFIRDDVVRAELSKPSMREDGFVTAWSERIILEFESDPEKRAGQSEPIEPSDIDVPVRRKVG